MVSKIITENISDANIILWNKITVSLSQSLFLFCRKALLQVLPTESNLQFYIDGKNLKIHIDLHDSSLDPIECVFLPSVRPDLILLDDSKIAVLELTICHEKNILKSRFVQNEQIQGYKFTLAAEIQKASSASVHHRNFSSRFYFELERFLHVFQNPKYANLD